MSPTVRLQRRHQNAFAETLLWAAGCASPVVLGGETEIDSFEAQTTHARPLLLLDF